MMERIKGQGREYVLASGETFFFISFVECNPFHLSSSTKVALARANEVFILIRETKNRLNRRGSGVSISMYLLLQLYFIDDHKKLPLFSQM